MSVLFNIASLQGVSLRNGDVGIQNFQSVNRVTLMAWMRTDAFPTAGNFGGICGLSIGPPPPVKFVARAEFYVSPSGFLTFNSEPQDGGPQDVVTTASIWITLGSVQHVACVAFFDLNKVDFYVDGNFAESIALPTASAPTSSTACANGGIGIDEDQTGSYFTGALEDVRFYNRELSADEIKTIAKTKGHDGIYWVLPQRYELSEGPNNSAVVNGGARDYSSLQFNGDPFNAPVYTPALITNFRRRLP